MCRSAFPGVKILQGANQSPTFIAENQVCSLSICKFPMSTNEKMVEKYSQHRDWTECIDLWEPKEFGLYMKKCQRLIHLYLEVRMLFANCTLREKEDVLIWHWKTWEMQGILFSISSDFHGFRNYGKMILYKSMITLSGYDTSLLADIHSFPFQIWSVWFSARPFTLWHWSP